MPLIAADRPPATPLDPALAMDFFSDESSQNGHRFLVLGTLAILQEYTPKILDDLAKARATHGHTGELAWSKVNSYKFQTYRDWLDIFARYAKSKRLRMTALILDTHDPRNMRWHTGDHELGFSKLLYHLLLHRIGKKYSSVRRTRPLYGQLDSRVTRHQPEDLRRMLNATLRRDYGVTSDPFRRLVFTDSKKSDLIQLVDILIGGLAFNRNEHESKPGTRVQKIELSWEIVELQQVPRVSEQFGLWDYVYQNRVS